MAILALVEQYLRLELIVMFVLARKIRALDIANVIEVQEGLAFVRTSLGAATVTVAAKTQVNNALVMRGFITRTWSAVVMVYAL